MGKTKILYILSSSIMGGATFSALSLIEEMAKRSYQVVVVSPDMDRPLRERLDSKNIPWHVIPLVFKAYPPLGKCFIKWPYHMFKTILVNFLAKRRIVSIIKKYKIDIVHTNVGPVTCGYEASVKVGVPHVWHIREYGDKDFSIKMFPSIKQFRKVLSKSYVISITQDLIRYNKLDGNPKAYVIYNGVRHRNDVRYENSKDNYFLCASRVSPEKGFEQVIRVFADFYKVNTDYRLVIIGFGADAYIRQLTQLAKELNVYQAIDFEGYKDNVSDYMAKAKALLVASPNEGFGRMTAEAAFAGCLVVGKNSAGTKEIMNITGGYPFNTDEEMLQAMNGVVELSEEQYRLKALVAQNKASQFFSEEKYVDSVFNLYNSICNCL